MRTRPGLRYSWKPASASPVFWMCGLVIGRPRPSAPASRSSGSPNVSGRLASSARTLTGGLDGMGAGRRLRLGLDERQVAVATTIEDAERRGLRVVEDDEAVAA